MNEEEKRINELIRKGDETVFATLFVTYYGELCNYGSAFVDRSEAEDIVARIFASFWEKRRSLNVTDSIRSFLYTSVRNACLNEIRKGRSRKAYQDYIYKRLQNIYDNPDEGDLKEISTILKETLEDLSKSQRTAFELSRFRDMSYKEIAEAMGVSVKSVEYYISLSLMKIREKMRDFFS